MLNKTEIKKVKSIVAKHLKLENSTYNVLVKNGYKIMQYDLKERTLQNVSAEIRNTFSFYHLYYNGEKVATLNADKIIGFLSSLKFNEDKNLLNFTYNMTFKKDNVINFKKDSSDIFQFLHFYLKGRTLNRDIMYSYFEVKKEYQNGKIDYKVTEELYNYLLAIYNNEFKDDSKIIKFTRDNKAALQNGYFNHFIINRVLELMIQKNIIKNDSDLEYNYVRLNPIIEKILNSKGV